MRLGRYACELTWVRWPRATAHRSFTNAIVIDMNSTAYAKPLLSKGMRGVGTLTDEFVEIAELPSHPWFLAVQFHPEFQSKPLTPHPLFASFVEASHRHQTQTRRLTTAAVTAAGR